MTSFRMMTLTAVASTAVAGFASDTRADHRYPTCGSYTQTTYVQTVPARTVVYTEPVRYYEPVPPYEPAPCVRTYPVYESYRRPVYPAYRPRYVDVRRAPVPRYSMVRGAPRHYYRPEARVRFDGRSHHHRRGFSVRIGR